MNSTFFLPETGEIRDAFNSVNWHAHQMGTPEVWSFTLKGALGLIMHSKLPMLLMWGQDLFQFYNEAFILSLSNKHPEAFGQKASICWKDNWHISGPLVNAVLFEDKACTFQNQLVPVMRNGKIEDIFWTFGYSPVKDENGVTRGVLVVCTETTQEVVAIRHLEQSRKWFRDLFDQSPVPMCVLSGKDHRYELANSAHINFIQRETLGKTVMETLYPEEIGPWVRTLDDVYSTGKPYVGNEIFNRRNADGTSSIRVLNFVFQPMYTDKNEISGIMVVFQDVTEEASKNERAMQLFNESKLAALGLMSAEIAHEINNPLAIMQSTCLIVEKILSAPNPDTVFLSEKIRGLYSTISRMTEIIQSMKNLVRDTSREEEEMFSIDEIIQDVKTLAHFQLRSRNIEFRVKADNKLYSKKIKCKRYRISQVLMNLISNALHSIEGLTTPWIELWVMLSDEFLIIQVTDSGPGVNPDISEKIFQPLFTTKDANKGTGLGLSISRDLIQKDGGTLAHVPEVSPTCFQLKLPVHRLQPI